MEAAQQNELTPPLVTYDASARLVFRICPTCSMPFSLPVVFFAARGEAREEIFCPAGHAHKANYVNGKYGPPVIAEALAAEVQARLDLQAAHREIARLSPLDTAAVDEKELKRRCNVIEARAERTGYGRRVCPFCGKPQAALRRHLKTYHADEVKAKPASAFA